MAFKSVKPTAGDTVVDAVSFHPLRGHVAESNVVRFPDGTMLRLKGTMGGWGLVDADGQQAFAPQRWADGLTTEIVCMADALTVAEPH